jgi:ADP-ribosylglycohydrolase
MGTVREEHETLVYTQEVLSRVQGGKFGLVVADDMAKCFVVHVEGDGTICPPSGKTLARGPQMEAYMAQLAQIGEREHLSSLSRFNEQFVYHLVKHGGYDPVALTDEMNQAFQGVNVDEEVVQTMLRRFRRFSSVGYDLKRMQDEPVRATCGPAASIFPLAIYQSVRTEAFEAPLALYEIVMDYSALADSHPLAGMAAYALAHFISEILRHPGEFVTNGLRALKTFQECMHHVRLEFHDRYTRGVLTRREDLAKFERALVPFQDPNFLFEVEPVELRQWLYPTDAEPWTAVFLACAFFIRNPDHFEEGVWEALQGGVDPEAVCAMTGGLIGLNLGFDRFPKRLRLGHPDYQRVFVKGRGLFQAARLGLQAGAGGEFFLRYFYFSVYGD